MKKLVQKYDIINVIRSWVYKLLIIACLCEILFFYSPANLYGCFTLLYGWILISTFVFKREYIQKYPLPTIAVFSLGFCYFFLPLIITLLEEKPLTFNFQVPYLTFSNQILNVTVIVLAFRASIKLYKPNCLLNKIWNKIGYMSILTEKQIWVIGFLGLIALISIVADQGQGQEYQSTGNMVEIIIRSISVFSIAPVCLYFKHLYGDNTISKTKKFVIYYIVILVIIGMATTRRTLIFNSVFVILLIIIFLAIYNNKKLFSRKNVIISLVLTYLVVGPLADISMAMILNRQSVYSSSASKTLEDVWKLYNDKEKLKTTYEYFMASMDNGGDNKYGWSEYYVNNIFLDRFCNLRTIDGTLYNAQKAGFGCYEGGKYYESFWINELPSFIANALGLKKDFQGTATDHMVINNFKGNNYTLFGFKVGGDTGIGLWMFGYPYYLIAFLTYIIVFYFLCSFVNFRGTLLLIPLPILVSFHLYWLFFLNANGIFTSMNYTFTRNSLNTILVYCILVFIIKKVFKKNK